MIYYNANKFGNHVEDCTVRSISVAEGISWDEAYRKLSEYARERGLMMNSVESVEEYLDDNYDRLCVEDMTVGEFAECHPYGTFLVTMLNHITAIKRSDKSWTPLILLIERCGVRGKLFNKSKLVKN